MNLNKMAALIEKRALSVSKRVLDGHKLESFDPRLLITADSDLDDHVDMQSSGQFYYGMLRQLALERLNEANNAYENWKAKIYDKCNEKIKKETGIKRPNKVDVENRIFSDYGKKVVHYKKIIRKREYVYDRLDIWYSSWIAKGFSVSDLKKNKELRSHSKNKKRSKKRKLFARRSKDGEEE